MVLEQLHLQVSDVLVGQLAGGPPVRGSYLVHICADTQPRA